jgi:hypothetical protein
MNVRIRVLLLLALLYALTLAPVRAQTPQYGTDQGRVTQALNDFWTLQGLGRAMTEVKPNWSALLGSSDWYEWNSLKINWTSNLADKAAQRRLLLDATITGLNAKGAQAAGYVWPSNGSEFWLCPHPHFDQMPRFICAVYNDYLWSRDVGFLRKIQPKIEAVMGYMTDTMQGRNGLLTCPGVYSGISKTSPNVTYMDCYREGGEVTWIEEGYYTALWDMAAMEFILGNRTQAATYAGRARRFPTQFHAQLWNQKTRRYVGWKDTGDTLHDYGFTYLNLEALARGLGGASDAYDIFDWLDHGTAQPTAMGGHVGSTDIYQCVVAPRSNTLPIPDDDWDFWSVSKSLRASTMGYGALVEDGGAMLWVNYYDVLARLKWLDADSAWRKFADMLFRVEGDPLRFTESVRHPTNVYGENYLEVGPADGPENGLSGTLPLSGFMGIRPAPDGLYCAPNLPNSLLFLTSRDVHYGLSAYGIRVARGRIVTTATTAQPFVAKSPFNTVGVRPAGLGRPNSGVAVQLKQRSGGVWTTVASSLVTVPYQNLYAYVPVPIQSAGTYRIILTPAMDTAVSPYSCRAAYEPVTRRGGSALGRTGAHFTAKRSFSRIEVRTAGRAPSRVTLLRQFRARWRPVEATWTEGSRGGVLSFADQPVGSYRLRCVALTGTYTLLSNRYTVTVTAGIDSTTNVVAAGETIKLLNDSNGGVSQRQGLP